MPDIIPVIIGIFGVVVGWIASSTLDKARYYRNYWIEIKKRKMDAYEVFMGEFSILVEDLRKGFGKTTEEKRIIYNTAVENFNTKSAQVRIYFTEEILKLYYVFMDQVNATVFKGMTAPKYRKIINGCYLFFHPIVKTMNQEIEDLNKLDIDIPRLHKKLWRRFKARCHNFPPRHL